MKLFKMELVRGRRGMDAIAHAETAETAETAQAIVASKYTGWQIRNCIEIPDTSYFITAEWDAG